MNRITKLLIVFFVTWSAVVLAQYGRREMYEPRWVSETIGRVHADLNRAYEGGWRISGGDRNRLDRAEDQLRHFAEDWNRGRFDKGDLDGAIGSIQRVVDHNRMPPRHRDALYRDLDRLRDMRRAYERHEIGRRY